MRTRIQLVVAALVVAALVVATLPADASITTTLKLLTVDPSSERDPACDGQDTVFTTNGAGTIDVAYIGSTGLIQLVATGPGSQSLPDISGDSVVFVDTLAGNQNVVRVKLSSGAQQYLTVDPSNESQPAISGDTVVMTAENAVVSGGSAILVFDLPSFTLDILVDKIGAEDAPAIDGDLVAWQVYQGGGDTDVMAMRLGGAPFVVSATAAVEIAPSVSGDRVAYIIDGDVEVYDTVTLVRTRVTADVHTQSRVRIHGDLVAWNDARNGNEDIFLHDLADGQTYQVTTDPSDQYLGDLDDGRLVFEDARAGNFNLWEITFDINHAPVADAGLDQDVAVGQVVALDGSAVDPDNDPVTSWQWAVDAAPGGSVATFSDATIPDPTFTPDAPGTYVLSLVASDGTDPSAPDTVVLETHADPWVDLGGAAGGVFGAPDLVATGPLVAGSTTTITVSDTRPAAAMVTWLSFSSTPLQALGGTVYAFPYSAQVFQTASIFGTKTTVLTWPAGVPSGTTFWLQVIAQDTSTPDGLALTNALTATTP